MLRRNPGNRPADDARRGSLASGSPPDVDRIDAGAHASADLHYARASTAMNILWSGAQAAL
jgi:hypothetical protein